MPKVKYKTQEEKKQAVINNAKRWYQNHKNDEIFKAKRKAYLEKYFKGLNSTKKEFLKQYNSDYTFYVRNIKTGKFEKRIVKKKEQQAKLEQIIKEMEEKLIDITNKFKHLDEVKSND